MIFPRCEWILKEVGVVLSGTTILVVSAIVLVTSVCCLSRRIELVRFELKKKKRKKKKQ